MPEHKEVDCPGLDSLLARLAEHDREQDWAEFIARHGRFIRQVCSQHLPSEIWLDDAVQETLLSLRADLPRYRRVTDAEAAAWLRLMAKHRALDLMRTESKRHLRERQIDTNLVCPDNDDLSEHQERLVQAVASLSPQQSAIISLRFVENLNNEEIATRLGISPASAQREGHRALQRLREILVPAQRERTPAMMAVLALLSHPGLLTPPAGAQESAGLVAAPATPCAAKAGLGTWVLWAGVIAVGLGGLASGVIWWRSSAALLPEQKPTVSIAASLPVVGIYVRGPTTVAEGGTISWYYTYSQLPATSNADAALVKGVPIKIKVSGTASKADFEYLGRIQKDSTHTPLWASVEVLKDNKIEGPETFIIEIKPDPSYRIDPDHQSLTFIITD